MNVLILGGTGLISESITKQLVERGDRVTVFNRGKRETPLPDGVTRLTGDRYDYATFEAQMQALPQYDAVIEMIGFTRADAESLLRAFAGRTGQLVFCSTVDVYNKPASFLPYTEDELQTHPLNDYARGKAEAEAALVSSSANLTILRPAHTYSDTSGLIWSFGWSSSYFDRLLKGKPIPVHGDGMSLWVSCHAEDVGRAFVNALGNTKAFNRAYHVTGEEWMTWNHYHQNVAGMIGAPPPKLVHIPTDLLAKAVPERAYINKVNFQFNNIFDNTAAKRDLGFAYTIPFTEGVRRMYPNLVASGRIEDSDKDDLPDRVIAAWERLSEALVGEFRG